MSPSIAGCARRNPTRSHTPARATVACGGHPLPAVLRAGGGVEELGVPGTLLGLVADPDLEDATGELYPGDTVVLYTDGLTEARVDPDNRYDESDLLEFLGGSAPMSAPGAVAAVRALLGGFSGKLDDDTAVLAIGVPTSTS